jgi:D-alanine transaminase
MNNQLIVYFNGKFLPQNEVHISPNDRGFVFGDGTYEVFRSYHGQLFFAEEHIERLKYSLHELRIQLKNTNQIIPIVKQLIRENNLEHTEATVYLQITRGVFKRMHAFPDEEVEPTIFIRAQEFRPYPSPMFESGVKVISRKDFRWTRCDIKSIALLSNILSAQEASDNQAFESIFIREGYLTEGSHTNVFVKWKDCLYTHPKSNYILSGISREIVIEICRKEGIPLQEQAPTEEQLFEADEVFLVGTSTEVMPVIQINEEIVGDGKRGKLTQKIQQLYRDYISDYDAP